MFHGPEGGGCCKGSFAVVSLGDGGSVSLGFGDRAIVDGPGPDFVVFENPFLIGGEGGEPFVEAGRVAVSLDGVDWTEFDCDPQAPLDTQCAGVSPVLTNVVKGEGDAFDPELSGGDLFDLADVGLEKVRYVRVTDVPGDGQVFDLDAMAILNGECE